MIDNEFLKVAQTSHFFDKHDRVLVALSGGIDSMNLLHLLVTFQKKLSIEIGLAHVNYGIRKESFEEQKGLEQLANDLQLPFYLATFSGDFSEEKAREFRYNFFKEVMQDQSYTALVTAHHADDQAETIFMRLLKGKRLIHLPSIQAVQGFGPGELIRPLLTFKKSDFSPVFHYPDSSNQENTYYETVFGMSTFLY